MADPARGAADEVAGRYAAMAVRALAAAERAVEEGRLNTAKVLRAAARSYQARALDLERLSGADSASVVAELFAGEGDQSVPLAAVRADGPRARALLQRARAASDSLREVLWKARASLEGGRDVPESAVAQFVWTCEECGFVAEDQRPEVCPACGSLGGEFELFAPFFSATKEHLSRRQPAEIVAMVTSQPGELHDVLGRMDEERLVWRADVGEWCAKEIAGHMVDIAELFVRRAKAALNPSIGVAEPPVLPWKIMEGRDYAGMPAGEILRRWDQAMAAAMEVVEAIGGDDWRKRGELTFGRVSLLDMASWLVNHNVAHLAQVRAIADGA